ncbi:hypothetical protein DMH04_47910 [Kibdelosporangium aridum]|uniref:Uncharacterized protein n=1 Tax=Kibdelosporangium aridum TaxID=2030 RepID=A0A428YJX8_KIBAR|nr:hypothetical protein [Kibdelosporangium aridum]RSM67904.1 hypothetical protein DMH04_47910 [Kibdelosporangium aridum]
MTYRSGEDTAVQTTTSDELDRLRRRIDQQTQHLNRHARDLQQLRHDLDSLDERLDAHQHHTG